MQTNIAGVSHVISGVRNNILSFPVTDQLHDLINIIIVWPSKTTTATKLLLVVIVTCTIVLQHF